MKGRTSTPSIKPVLLKIRLPKIQLLVSRKKFYVSEETLAYIDYRTTALGE